MKGRYKQLIAGFIVISLIGMVGCTTSTDLNDQAYVTAIGFDKGPEGKVELTVQIVKPSVLKRDGGGDKEAFWTFTSIGETTFEAIRNMLTTVNRKLYFAHAQFMVFGEELARDGILKYIEAFERDQESNLKAFLLIAKGTTAKKILEAKSELEQIPAAHITDIIENNEATTKLRKITLMEFYRQITQERSCPLLGVIVPRDKNKEKFQIKDLKIEGGAVIRGDKLAGYTDTIQTQSFLLLKEEVGSGIINVSDPYQPDKKIAIEIVGVDSSMDVILNGEEVSLICEINIKGNLGGQQSQTNLATEKALIAVEKQVEKKISRQVEETVILTQEKGGCDIFGFSGITHRKYLDFWKNNESNWKKFYSQASIRVETIMHIEKIGMVKRPVKRR